MPSEEHEPPKLILQTPARARASIRLPRLHPGGQGPRGAGAQLQRGMLFPVARGAPAPSRARCRGSLRRKGAQPGRAPGSPGARAPLAKVGAREDLGRTQAWLGGAAGFLALQSYKGLRGTKRKIGTPGSTNSALTPDS